MLNENLEKETEFSQDDLDKLGLEVAEISSSTMLEELGASFGKNSCSSVIIVPS